MKRLLPSIIVLLATNPANAGLLGTELSLRILAQSTSTSTPVTMSFEQTAVVGLPGVEFPNVASLVNPNAPVLPGFSGRLVDVAIDVNDNYIDIDFDNSSPYTRFATGFENTYVFKFDNAVAVNIKGAEIDSSVTTLGLEPSDVRFVGNELFVNVESLTFNPSTFVRIKLAIDGGNIDPTQTPKPFKFISITNVKPNALVTSKPATINGLQASFAPISVINGEYSINCKKRKFTKANAFIKNKQKVCIRHVAAPTRKTVTSTILSVGGRNVTFSSKTK